MKQRKQIENVPSVVICIIVAGIIAEIAYFEIISILKALLKYEIVIFHTFVRMFYCLL